MTVVFCFNCQKGRDQFLHTSEDGPWPGSLCRDGWCGGHHTHDQQPAHQPLLLPCFRHQWTVHEIRQSLRRGWGGSVVVRPAGLCTKRNRYHPYVASVKWSKANHRCFFWLFQSVTCRCEYRQWLIKFKFWRGEEKKWNVFLKFHICLIKKFTWENVFKKVWFTDVMNSVCNKKEKEGKRYIRDSCLLFKVCELCVFLLTCKLFNVIFNDNFSVTVLTVVPGTLNGSQKIHK